MDIIITRGTKNVGNVYRVLDYDVYLAKCYNDDGSLVYDAYGRSIKSFRKHYRVKMKDGTETCCSEDDCKIVEPINIMEALG